MYMHAVYFNELKPTNLHKKRLVTLFRELSAQSLHCSNNSPFCTESLFFFTQKVLSFINNFHNTAVHALIMYDYRNAFAHH